MQKGVIHMSAKKPRGDTQERILAYIEKEILDRGYAPSVREIGEAVGLRSTSTVHGHLMRLEKKGLLHRDAMKPRAMGVLKRSDALQIDAEAHVHQIPLVGNVAAGTPILAEESIEDLIPLPSDFVGEGEHFILRVCGDSMIQAGILSGDYIVVKKQAVASNGEIVVAMVEDRVRFLSWDDPLEKGKAMHSSILAWRIPWTVWSMGWQSQSRLSDFLFTGGSVVKNLPTMQETQERRD